MGCIVSDGRILFWKCSCCPRELYTCNIGDNFYIHSAWFCSIFEKQKSRPRWGGIDFTMVTRKTYITYNEECGKFGKNCLKEFTKSTQYLHNS